MNTIPGDNFCTTSVYEKLKTYNLVATNGISFFDVPIEGQQQAGMSVDSLFNVLLAYGFVKPILWAQQAGPLIGTGFTGSSFQGTSVVLSNDGTTIAVGGPGDNASVGGVWIFVKSGTLWVQQAGPLVGIGATGASLQGTSVALSSDGNTLAIGGPGDNGSIGAVWIFTRSGTIWTQQAGPLTGTGFLGQSLQGTSVSLSSDGNTLAIGGPGNNSGIGAFWVFIRIGVSWLQQTAPVISSDYIGVPLQGTSVSLTSDGNTLVIGGPGDSFNNGAVWIYHRDGGTWSKILKLWQVRVDSQQGTSVAFNNLGNVLIVGAPFYGGSSGLTLIYELFENSWVLTSSIVSELPGALQGQSVSVSRGTITDSTHVVVTGAPNYASGIGQSIPYSKQDDVWVQQSACIIGLNTSGYAYQGVSTSLNDDGTILVVGGSQNDSGIGGVGGIWIFRRVSGV